MVFLDLANIVVATFERGVVDFMFKYVCDLMFICE